MLNECKSNIAECDNEVVVKRILEMFVWFWSYWNWFWKMWFYDDEASFFLFTFFRIPVIPATLLLSFARAFCITWQSNDYEEDIQCTFQKKNFAKEKVREKKKLSQEDPEQFQRSSRKMINSFHVTDDSLNSNYHWVIKVERTRKIFFERKIPTRKKKQMDNNPFGFVLSNNNTATTFWVGLIVWRLDERRRFWNLLVLLLFETPIARRRRRRKGRSITVQKWFFFLIFVLIWMDTTGLFWNWWTCQIFVWFFHLLRNLFDFLFVIFSLEQKYKKNIKSKITYPL